jgi:hypothetical protein
MTRFRKTHVFILPHAEEYRQHYHVSFDEILLTLNEPEEEEKVFDDRCSATRTFGNRRVMIDFYITLPLQIEQDSVYAIIDFVSVEEIAPLTN